MDCKSHMDWMEDGNVALTVVLVDWKGEDVVYASNLLQ